MIDKEIYLELKKTIQEVRQDLEVLRDNLNEFQNMAIRAQSVDELTKAYENFNLEEGLKYISIWEGKEE